MRRFCCLAVALLACWTTPGLCEPVSPSSPAAARIAEGTRLCDEAERLSAQGKTAEALALYQAVLRLLPTSPRARTGLAESQKRLRQGAGGSAGTGAPQQRRPPQRGGAELTLHQAAAAGNVARVQELLAHGEDPNTVDAAGSAALHYASHGGHDGVVAALLNRGAEADLPGPGGVRALHLAAAAGAAKVVDLLCDVEANPWLAGPGGQLPAAVARQAGHQELGDRIERYARSDGEPVLPMVLRSASRGGSEWRFVLSPPADGWTSLDFDDTGWQRGRSGFGNRADRWDRVRTRWDTGEIWLRRSLHLTAPQAAAALLYGMFDGDMQVYVNGVCAFSNAGWTGSPAELPMTPEGPGAFRPGRNIVAVRCKTNGAPDYLDLGVALNPYAGMPSAGWENCPAAATIAASVREYMVANHIPGGAVAVMAGPTVRLVRSFGWADRWLQRPLPEDAPLLLASNDKLVSKAGALALVGQGVRYPADGEVITLRTRVLDILRASGHQRVPADPRFADITLEHLLEHQAGLNDTPGPPDVRRLLGLPEGTRVTLRERVDALIAQRLAFTPGEKTAYCNVGYDLVRYLLELVTGDLTRFLRESVFSPVGSKDVLVDRSDPVLRDPREGFYVTWRSPGDNVNDYRLEDYLLLSASAEAMVRFLRRYHVARCTPLEDPATGRWAATPDNGLGVYFGAFGGTFTAMVQRRWSQRSYVVLLNKGGGKGQLLEPIDKVLDQTTGWD